MGAPQRQSDSPGCVRDTARRRRWTPPDAGVSTATPAPEPALSRVVADLLRWLALIAVIAIHANDAWRAVTTHPIGVRAWAIVAVDQLGRFCVPLFVLLSGHALGKRYAADWSTGEFLARRATRIGGPYLTWSLLNLALAVGASLWLLGGGWTALDEVTAAALRSTTDAPADAPIWPTALRWLLTGAADYHLYFLPIIAQCYLLFPLMRRWRCTGWAVGLVVTVQIGALAWQQAARLTPAVPAPGLWSVFPLYWLGYFQVGIWLATHDQRATLVVRRWPGWVVALLAISGPGAVLGDLAWECARGVPAEFAGAFDRPAVAWYLATLVVCALRWGDRVEAWHPRVTTLISAIAAGSFAAFLSHTWVLRGLAWILGSPAVGADKPLTRWVWIPLALVASLTLGWLLHRAARRWRPLGWMVG